MQRPPGAIQQEVIAWWTPVREDGVPGGGAGVGNCAYLE